MTMRPPHPVRNRSSSGRWGRIIGRFVGVFALAGTPYVQGCNAQVAECAIDSDCDQGQACEASNCVPVCGTDADCLQGEVCLEGSTTALRICQVRDDSGSNVALVQSTIALIRDSSAEDCDGEAPGSDLAFVVLENSDGDVEGWGNIVASQINGEANAFPAATHIDGDRPATGADSCPEPSVDTLMSLGCDGFVAVAFTDEDGEPVSLLNKQHRIRVGERGTQCEDPAEDAYRLFLCPGANSVDDVPGACGVEIGAGSGERVFDL